MYVYVKLLSQDVVEHAPVIDPFQSYRVIRHLVKSFNAIKTLVHRQRTDLENWLRNNGSVLPQVCVCWPHVGVAFMIDER